MDKDIPELQVSAALAGVRRRARLLAEAQGTSHWTEWVSIAVGVAAAGFLIVSDEASSTNGAGFVLLASVIGGAQLRRLQKRVEAMTQLLRDIGYPDEA